MVLKKSRKLRVYKQDHQREHELSALDIKVDTHTHTQLKQGEKTPKSAGSIREETQEGAPADQGDPPDGAL